MKAILVDDELLPLEHLKNRLENELKGIEVIGTYLNPSEAEIMINQVNENS